MKRTYLLFPIAMLAMTLLTASRYAQIREFKRNSAQFSLEFDASESDVKKIRDELQGITFQPVEEIQIDGRRRLTFRCPPDKLPLVLREIGREE